MPTAYRGLCLFLLVAVSLLAGCTGPPRGNLLQDPGFESGGEGWFFLEGREDWVGFTVVEDPVESGNRSLRTRIDVASVGNHSLVAGAVQELSSDTLGGRLPERLSGAYRVEAWETEVERAYVQAVVGVFPKEGTRGFCPGIPATAPCQLAYVLTGVDDRPLPLANRRYYFQGMPEPTLDEWVRFDLTLREDFRLAWGTDLGSFDRVWIYLETRYDAGEEEQGSGGVRADVYWDGLFLGS